MSECPQHRLLQRCAHLGDRFIYEYRKIDRPVAYIVCVDHNLAESVFTIPRCRDFDEVFRESWERAEDWVRA